LKVVVGGVRSERTEEGNEKARQKVEEIREGETRKGEGRFGGPHGS
jgi:hypothetical protein